MKDYQYIKKRIREYELEKTSSSKQSAFAILKTMFNFNSIFSVNSEPAEVIPKWNLGVFGSTATDADLGPYLSKGSAVLLAVNGHPNRYAITAGHILSDDNTADKTRWFKASWNTNRIDHSASDKLAIKVIANFNTGKHPFDLAILEISGLEHEAESYGIKLLSDVEFSDKLKNSVHGVVFGWGLFNPDKDNFDRLAKPALLRDVVMEVDSIVSRTDNRIFVCKSFDDRGPCQGDSGGPLVVIQGDEIKLAGIVLGRPEGGDLCHTEDFPTQFLAPSCVMQELKKHIPGL